MYPSGYKEDKLYSILPKDGSGDLTFARSSSATRVNESGLIETPSVLGSELVTNGDFATNTDWVIGEPSTMSISGGKAVYASTSINQRLTSINIPSMTVGKSYVVEYTISDYVSGSIFLERPNNTSSELSSANGTYKFTLVATTTSVRLRTFSASNTFKIDNVSVKEVITSNIPRIDYLGGGCGKLILEPQRTNTVLSNSDYTASWALVNVIPTANATISPNGSNDAQKLTSANTFGQHYIRQILGGHTVGAPHVFSCFAKAAELDILTLRLFQGDGGNVTFDLTNGTITSGTNGKIIDFGNGWYRCMTYHSALNQYLYPYIYTQVGNQQGDGVSGFYVYGAMIEEGTYETSLIDTTTTNVTRTQDTSITTGLSSVIGQTEGTLQFKFEKSKIIEDYAVISLMSTGTDAIMIGTRNFQPANDSLRLLFYKAGALLLNITLATNIGNGTFNVAVAYKLNDWSVFVDGVEVYTNTSVAAPSLLTELRLLNRFGTAYNFSYPVENLSLFTTRLSNTELATLTTL